jgi:intracellular sulfur oxidation DsrE/DsrF family protein
MRKLIIAAAMLGSITLPAYAEGETHYVAIHVDENDPQVMNMALNNVQNVNRYYESQGDEVIIELVAYGPGLNMFVADTSPVATRISAMSLEIENLSFAACGNTHRAMIEKTGGDVTLLEEARVVPSGVIRLIQLQEEGFAYIRP